MEVYGEGYVPLRTSDEMYDDEGFPTRTRRWDKKYGDALINVGREKAKGRYGGTPNISRGVSAARKLEKMKKIDAEPESRRAARSQAAAERNKTHGANKRRLQTSLDRQHLERSFNREEVDLYDIILSHLLDEGYAETPEAAEAIMVNMSEEWRDVIVEGKKSLPIKKMKAKEKYFADPERPYQGNLDLYKASIIKDIRQKISRRGGRGRVDPRYAT